MNTAVAAPELALAPAQDGSAQTVRRVSNAPEPAVVANDAAFFQAAYDDEALDDRRPMRGILLGVLLGALCWAGIIGLIFALT